MPWLFAIDTTSTDPPRSAANALGGVRNTNVLPAAAPPFVTAVSRFATAMSASPSTGCDRLRAGPSGSAASFDCEDALEVHVSAEGEDDRLSAAERPAHRCAAERSETPRSRVPPSDDDERRDGGEQDAGEDAGACGMRITRWSGWRGIGCAVTIARPWSRLEAVRKGIVQLVAIGIVIGVALTLVAVLFQWLPKSASEEFDRIQAIYWFVTIISIVIFSLVTAVVIFSVWKWRVPEDDDLDGPPIHGHTGLEILWTAIPAVLVTVDRDLQRDRAGPKRRGRLDDRWRCRRSGSSSRGSSSTPTTTTSSRASSSCPVGQEARFTMTAVDVIHSFWVPNFGQKMDAVPGIETEILVTPDRMGDFAVVCTELCGLGHATMRASARVVSEQEFDAWIEENQT